MVALVCFQYTCSHYCLPNASFPGLIVHEGSSVYRIFKRWQAVNQQWKVLNYEKAKDLEDPMNSAGKGGGRASRNNPHGSANGVRGGRRGQRVRTILNHHCGYTLLHILSQLRPNDHRISATANREVVMRVTTVWNWRHVRTTAKMASLTDYGIATNAWRSSNEEIQTNWTWVLIQKNAFLTANKQMNST